MNDNPESETEFPEVLSAALGELTRQESRVDVKAGQLAALAGTMASITVAATATISSITHRGPGWIVLVPLMVAASLWVAAYMVVAILVIRPRLPSEVRVSFLSETQIDDLRQISLADHQAAIIGQLRQGVFYRYRAVRLATDLLLTGFIPLLAAGLLVITGS